MKSRVNGVPASLVFILSPNCFLNQRMSSLLGIRFLLAVSQNPGRPINNDLVAGFISRFSQVYLTD